MYQYIYLLQEREFIKTKEPIYKIGKTKQENSKRFLQYPKGSVLIFQILCENCDISEKQLIKIFKEKYKLRQDIGSEYFEGDFKKMINDIYFIINNDQILFSEKPTPFNIFDFISSKFCCF